MPAFKMRPFAKISRCFLLFVSFLPGSLSFAAQEESFKQATQSEESVALTSTFEKTDISIPELKLRLKPLTKEELQAEVDGWLNALKSHQTAISQKEVLSLRMNETGGDNSKITKELAELSLAKSSLVNRVKAALKAYEAKGGDITEQKKYTDVVSNLQPQVTDANALLAMLTAWLKSPDGGIAFALNLAKFIAILVAARFLAGFLAKLARKGLRRANNLSSLLRDFVVNSIRKSTIIIGIVIAISVLGVDISPILAAVGAAGFVIAFALQGTLSNFASGLMILLYRPYDVSDVVTVGGVTGKVNKMSLVSTTITTADNQNIVLPNNTIWGGTITNITGNSTRRVDLVFGIGYTDDIGKTTELLMRIAKAHRKVLADPQPVVQVHELADSSVNLVVRPWVKTEDYWDVYWDLTRQVKEEFDREGISIPFPQRDIHLHQVDQLVSA